ncbi:hypothetical protein [Motiliproteus coralliicola]|nr:hypothetical protein [Motiliproteus coralliicola]
MQMINQSPFLPLPQVIDSEVDHFIAHLTEEESKQVTTALLMQR